jgi:hypothetical protein
MQIHHDLSVDRCIALSDEELAHRTFAAIAALVKDELNDSQEEAIDALYFLADETFERFAPHAALAALVELYNEPDDPEAPENLLDGVEAMRRRQAARLLRDTVGSDDA